MRLLFSVVVIRLVAGEEVAGVDLVADVGEGVVGAVGEDGPGEALELVEVVDHAAAEERAAVLQRGLVDDHRRALRLDALHHALYRRVAEIVGIRFHRQSVNADHG